MVQGDAGPVNAGGNAAVAPGQPGSPLQAGDVLNPVIVTAIGAAISLFCSVAFQPWFGADHGIEQWTGLLTALAAVGALLVLVGALVTRVAQLGFAAAALGALAVLTTLLYPLAQDGAGFDTLLGGWWMTLIIALVLIAVSAIAGLTKDPDHTTQR